MMILSEGALHGYALVDRLKDSPLMGGVKPDGTGVYRLLATLESQGLVTHCLEDSDLGPSKRVFDLTDAGRKCLTTWICTLEKYRDGIDQLIQLMRATSVNEGTSPC
jgi:DNA-binding PadR family transcriptional regulator